MGGFIKKIISPIIKFVPKFISNPIVGIGVSLFLSWILRHLRLDFKTVTVRF